MSREPGFNYNREHSRDYRNLIELNLIPESRESLEEEIEVLSIVEWFFESLDNEMLNYILSGYDNDIERFTSELVESIKEVILCRDFKGENRILFGDYYPRLGGHLEEVLKQENLTFFIQSVLPDFDLSWHHLEWGNFITLHKYLCIIAARNLGKSYYFSYAYPLWKMYRYQKVEQLTRVPRRFQLSFEGVIFCFETGLGTYLLNKIKHTIEDNEILREKLFSKNNVWNDREISTLNGASLYVKSYGSAARGRHPGYAIVDDFLIENVIYSKMQRDKISDYVFSVIENMVLKEGQIVVTGTPFHQEDLYGQLKKTPKNKKYKVFEYPAIFPDGTLTYPKRYTFKDLKEKRETQGNLIFSREILCKSITSNSTIFPYELLSKSFIGMEDYSLVSNRISYSKRFSKVVMGCDFAMSSSVGADYSVFMTWGVEEDGTMTLLHVYREKGKSYQDQINAIKQIYANFQHNIIFLEDVAFQKIFVQETIKAGLPVRGHHTGVNKNSLKDGLPGLAVLFENNKIKFPRGDQYSRDISDLIIGEFSSVAFTDNGRLESVGQHDDTCMSTWISWEASRYQGGLSLKIL